ncbi:hypothetical protein SNE40_016362 [Patella caerulea]|uniref:Uncharacterized protein n=1 Tax=Patella caerulea TaxID=87958 RepID=A0AAN8P826_PATCE
MNGILSSKNSKSVKTTTFSDVPTIHTCEDISKYLNKKDSKVKFSEGLSPEGKLAMEMALEETKESKRKVVFSLPEKAKAAEPSEKLSQLDLDPQQNVTRQKSFSDAYEKSSSFRLEDDITSENYSSRINKPKRALGGGRLYNAMETVEIVKHGEPPSDTKDADDAMEETAKRNSVEKCLVWMEVTGLAADGHVNDP